MKSKLSVLFFGKNDKPLVVKAAAFLKENFKTVNVVLGNRKEEFPLRKTDRAWDVVVSYISPWIIPPWVLKSAKIGAINFHPGPPEYPGIGCTNFALYHQEKKFGATCHLMDLKVDTGKVILVKRFPILKSDSVFSLTMHAYKALDVLFYRIIEGLKQGKPLPVSKEKWTRKPYTRKELDDLCRIHPSMSAQEIQRRVKATAYPGMPGAYVILGNEKFVTEKISR